MECICSDLYPNTPITKPNTNAATMKDSNELGLGLWSEPVSASVSESLPCKRIVRLLWDIENMNPLMLRNSNSNSNSNRTGNNKNNKRRNNTIDFMVDLNRFLADIGCLGPGIDCQLSTFINFIRNKRPEGKSEGGGRGDNRNKIDKTSNRYDMYDRYDRCGYVHTIYTYYKLYTHYKLLFMHTMYT